ncbi:MAG: ATP-binding protein [Cyclobacteriaceae bacterium]|nr:ATP-binding protein [Cyclobacteriaceae bacterium]MCH8514732.1 ATP-binding protein [Cyclobacteriaceae bacterium]
MQKKKLEVHLSWSGGKDALMALDYFKKSEAYLVVGLHTTIDSATNRVGLHGVHQSLIQEQANQLGLPIDFIPIPFDNSYQTYEEKMVEYYCQLASRGIAYIASGDIFLADLKAYKVNLLSSCKLFGLFPLWGQNTKSLLEKFHEMGNQTIICAADANFFNSSAIGQPLDQDHILENQSIDPCGEYGEFHTFVNVSNHFKSPVEISCKGVVSKVYKYNKTEENGDVVELKSKFWFADLVLK